MNTLNESRMEPYYCMKVEMMRRFLKSIGLEMPKLNGNWRKRFDQARHYTNCFVLEAH